MIASTTTNIIIAANNAGRNANPSGATDPLLTYTLLCLIILALAILIYSIAESHYVEYKRKKENEKNKAEGKMHF